jgi:uncharacterized membrane protein YraQ (UPF0718 family)
MDRFGRGGDTTERLVRLEERQTETSRRLGNVENDVRELRRHIDEKFKETQDRMDESLKPLATLKEEQKTLAGRVQPIIWIGAIIASVVVGFLAQNILASGFPAQRPGASASRVP